MEQSILDAIARLNTSITTELKAIADKLNEPNPDTPTIVTALNAAADRLDAETAALTGGQASGTTA